MIILGAGAGGMRPSAPTIGTATAGDTTASVAFTPSTYIGKGTITYTATSSPGGFTGTASSSPITVSGLTNGTAYTFTVVGTTNYGVASVASAASNSITPATASSFEAIASYTASGTVSDITFSSIPSTYKILHFRLMIRDASASASDRSILAQFNGNTTASNYRYNRMYSYGGTNVYGLDYDSSVGAVYGGITLGDSATSGDYGGNIFEIIDYANTSKTKQVRQYGGSSASQFNSAGLWTGTNAINSVKFYLSSGASGMKIYSTIALYGIKG